MISMNTAINDVMLRYVTLRMFSLVQPLCHGGSYQALFCILVSEHWLFEWKRRVLLF